MPSTRSARALHLTQNPDLNKSRGYADAVYTEGNQRRFPIFRLPSRKHFIIGLISDRPWGHISRATSGLAQRDRDHHNHIATGYYAKTSSALPDC
jgi:hypothetical protein